MEALKAEGKYLTKKQYEKKLAAEARLAALRGTNETSAPAEEGEEQPA